MNTFFEQSRSHWVRYERYEIKTGKEGKKYITPARMRGRMFTIRSRKPRTLYWMP